MNKNKFEYIKKWEEKDLTSLPKSEDEIHEYKSSETPLNDLGKKINVASSAFWNSGGGLFIVGIKNGIINGGVKSKIGRQDVRDWIDQKISNVEPVGSYYIKIIRRKNKNSLINKNHVILVIAFEESLIAPHMAQDNKYYVRLGAHTAPAGHFLIESIRAKRGLIVPLLRGILKSSNTNPDIIQLLVVASNEAPALEVEISFDPFPKMFDKIKDENFQYQVLKYFYINYFHQPIIVFLLHLILN